MSIRTETNVRSCIGPSAARQVVVALLLVGCAPSPQKSAAPVSIPAAEPCSGSDFDLDALPESCEVENGRSSGSGIRASLVLESNAVRSGGEAPAELKLENAGAAPLVLFVHPGCSFLSLGAEDSSGQRADYVSDGCTYGMVCSSPVFRIVLQPGGKLTKKLSFTARVTHADRPACEEKAAEGLKPGIYQLRLWGTLFNDDEMLRSLRAPLQVR